MSSKGGQCSHLMQFLVEVKVPPVQGVTVEGSGWGQRHLAAIRDDVMSTPTKAKHNMPAHSHVHTSFKGLGPPAACNVNEFMPCCAYPRAMVPSLSMI